MPQPSSAGIDLGLAVLSGVNTDHQPLTYQTIAAACGCSHKTIQTIEKRAMEKVRVRLNQILREEIE